MVRIVLLLLISTTALAITPEELARLSEKGAAERRAVENQLNLEDLRYEVKVGKSAHQKHETGLEKGSPVASSGPTSDSQVHAKHAEPTIQSKVSVSAEQGGIKYINGESQKNSVPVAQTPVDTENRVSKYGPHPHEPQNRVHPQDVRMQQRVQPHGHTGHQSRAPVQTSRVKPETFTDAVSTSTRKYGIRRGTWIYAELRRDINNAEPGDVEIFISKAVYGSKLTLPAGTQLFADKRFNNATQRLEMYANYAITPDGKEMPIEARIYDTQKVSGLSGIVDVDDSKITQEGTSEALASLGGSVLGEFDGSAIGRAVGKGGKNMIDNQKQASQFETNQQVTIYVAPQKMLLRVEQTF